MNSIHIPSPSSRKISASWLAQSHVFEIEDDKSGQTLDVRYTVDQRATEARGDDPGTDWEVTIHSITVGNSKCTMHALESLGVDMSDIEGAIIETLQD